MKTASIDFEFFDTNERDVRVVCCSIATDEGIEEFWTLGGEETDELKEYIADLNRDGYIFLAYAAIAEARALSSIGVDPTKLRWVDLYNEWRCLTNHNYELQYGRQLIGGKEIVTKPPKGKWEQTEEERREGSNQKAENSLAAFLYKMLNVKVDTEHKTAMRDIIISADEPAIIGARKSIQTYCSSDVAYLEPALKKVVAHFKKRLSSTEFSKLTGHMLWRGEYSVRTALIERQGYLIDYSKTKNFSDSVPYILKDIQQDIVGLFPDMKLFRYDPKKDSYTWNQVATREYIRSLGKETVSKWLKTDKGDLSLSLEAFKQFFDFRHNYPTDIAGAQIVRYLNTKQNLNGFTAKAGGGKKTFWDSVGRDSRVRPFLGIYGSQSGRNQPSATGFLFLKSAWMRALCIAPAGRMNVGIDYGSEEFLIGGLLSEDMNMINAYHSGDPYLYFGKAARAIPAEGTKESHGFLRDKFKSTTLGIQYLMGAEALANKLTLDTGVAHSVEEAEDLIDLFNEVFSDYAEYRNEICHRYDVDKYLQLTDGWTMFGDNPNFRSVANFPVQGTGSVVLRRMVKYLQEAGLTVFKTLHDAGYCEMAANDWAAVDLMADEMQRAFRDCFDWSPVRKHANIRVDINAWGDGIDTKPVTPKGRKVKAQNIYIDGRSIEEYNKFSKYFENDVAKINELL